MEVYNDEGEVICDKPSVLNEWKKEFEKLFKAMPDGTNNDLTIEEQIRSRIINDSLYLNEMRMADPLYEEVSNLNRNIELDEVRQAVNRTKLRKATGVDKLQNEVLKNEQSIKLLHKMFELCMDTGIVPDTWTKSIIKPISKSAESDPRIPLNYRGISLISCVAKVFSSVLNKRIVTFLDENHILPEEQNGFRKNRSCIDHVFILHSVAKSRQLAGLKTYITFIDFAKAFDCINRELLLYAILKSGIEGKTYYVLKAMYNLTKACVTINGSMTDWFTTELGVRQGDNLSPTLFSIFINELAQQVKQLDLGINIGNGRKLSILLYADDLAILSENPIDMQEMLNCINEWCDRVKMKINMSKTKLMEIRKKGEERSLAKFTLGLKAVPKCSDYKY